MTQTTNQIGSTQRLTASASAHVRRGAIGKALLVWLLSGSFGIAVIALIIFAMMGC